MKALRDAMILLVLSIQVTAHFPPVKVAGVPPIPFQTDDGLDPINLVWTGFSPAWGVAQNFKGWNPTPCSTPKTVNDVSYDFTLETPNTLVQTPPCWGPRFHVRIWDMGDDPEFGRWSIGAAHFEHTECDYFCHHVVDSWEGAEAEVRDTFAESDSTFSIGSYFLGNKESYQGVFNDGNATIIRLSRPGVYPIIFTGTGLKEGTPWSVDLNGTVLSSNSDTITFEKSNGTYPFIIIAETVYKASPSSGTISVSGNRVHQPITFTQHLFSITFTKSGLPDGLQWTVTFDDSPRSSVENITFVKPAGNYQYSVRNLPGYLSDPTAGNITVKSDQEVIIKFAENTSTSASLPTNWVIAYAILGSLAAVGTLWGLRFFRERQRPRVQPPSTFRGKDNWALCAIDSQKGKSNPLTSLNFLLK